MKGVYRKIAVPVLIVLIFMPQTVGASGCLARKYPAFIPISLQERASEIFYGKIIDIEGSNIKFEVIDIYKGEDKEYKVVDTHSARNHDRWSGSDYMKLLLENDENTLHRSAKIGDEWLIYGHKNSKRKIDEVKEITGDEITPDSLYVYYKDRGCRSIIRGTRPYSEVTTSDIVQLYLAPFIPEIYVKYALYVFYGLVFFITFSIFFKTLSLISKILRLMMLTMATSRILSEKRISLIITFLLAYVLYSILVIYQISDIESFFYYQKTYILYILYIAIGLEVIALSLINYKIVSLFLKTLRKFYRIIRNKVGGVIDAIPDFIYNILKLKFIVIAFISLLGTLLVFLRNYHGFSYYMWGKYSQYENEKKYSFFFDSLELFLNHHITVIIMMVLPIFLTVYILFKIYKYFKKKTAKL